MFHFLLVAFQRWSIFPHSFGDTSLSRPSKFQSLALGGRTSLRLRLEGHQTLLEIAIYCFSDGESLNLRTSDFFHIDNLRPNDLLVYQITAHPFPNLHGR